MFGNEALLRVPSPPPVTAEDLAERERFLASASPQDFLGWSRLNSKDVLHLDEDEARTRLKLISMLGTPCCWQRNKGNDCFQLVACICHLSPLGCPMRLPCANILPLRCPQCLPADASYLLFICDTTPLMPPASSLPALSSH